MTDNLKIATKSLEEQTKKLEIASYYTHDDLEKAKQMVAGTYSDMYVVKAKFSSSTVYCSYILFINSIYLNLVHVEAVVSNSYDIADMKTSIDWKIFEKEIMNERSKGNHDEVITNGLKDTLAAAVDMAFLKEVIKLFSNNEEISANHNFKKLATGPLGFQNVEITVDFDQISSLDMELYSETSKKINLAEIQRIAKEAEKQKEIRKNTQTEGPLAGREVKMLLKGSMILSPIKGKPISALIKGDKVKVSIVDNDIRAIDVAKAFDAYDVEKQIFRPINGRVIAVQKQSVGYKIFVIIAKAIFLEIDEEEEGIKVGMDPSSTWGKEDLETSTKKISFPMMIVLSVVLIVLIGVILMFVK